MLKNLCAVINVFINSLKKYGLLKYFKKVSFIQIITTNFNGTQILVVFSIPCSIVYFGLN